mgnify:CR=1 FL=1
MKFKIPFKTPTVNHLYGRKGFRSYLKPEAKKLREEIKEIIINSSFPLFSEEDRPLKVNVEIHEDWFCKNGSVKR